MFRFLRFCLLWGIVFGLVGAGVGIYIIYHYSQDLPDYGQLANYHPPSVTRVYSADGKLIEEYALEHRVFVPINSVPRSLIEAFVAAEDKNYFNHPGVDILSIVRAAINNIPKIIQNKKTEGGSTITQQVVKNFLLTSEHSLSRKIKEAILSYMISRTFTKEQILELYLNQIFLGHGAYGVAVAAQNYFNKSVDELTVAESAFLAALPKSPSSLDPKKNYARVKERRDYVLVRMLEDGYITPEVAKEAIELEIKLAGRDKSETVSADYYAEAVRQEAIKMLGKDDFYTGGYTIITSLNAEMQNHAREALRYGIRLYDMKKGWRGAMKNIDLVDWQATLKTMQSQPGILEYKVAVVLEPADKIAKIGLDDGSIGKIAIGDAKWARSSFASFKDLFKKGDVIIVEKLKGDSYALRQIPTVNGAIIVMNQTTGQVFAAEGGYDFSVSRFDRVSQAQRQPGSLAKGFVYLAALENGVQPNRIFEDAPIAMSQGPGMPLWKPKNYKGDFLGKITMRVGLEKSRNLITVRVAEAIGLGKVVEIFKRFGIDNNPKRVYSMVLGALETTLEKVTAAYATIANYGQKVTPSYIELIKDRNGRIVYRRDTRPCLHCSLPLDFEDFSSAPIPPDILRKITRKITDEATSYQIISMMEGAAQRGTAARTKQLGTIVAAKTGTTNDSKDTWFVGFTPLLTVGTFIGYDTPKDMGKTATGSTVAQPVFIAFMERAYKGYPSLEFKVPEGVKLVPVNLKTGEPWAGQGSIMEAFRTTSEESVDSGAGNAADVFDKIEDRPTKPEIDNSQEIY